MGVVKEYEAKLDNKHRITIRGAYFEYYKVKEYGDGHLELLPRVLVDPNEISLKSLNMMDKSIENLKKGTVSEPINLESYTNDGNNQCISK